jgi:DNA replication protein DnaC
MTSSEPLDFPWCLAFLERHGKERFGPTFTIHACDHPVIYKLLIYFLQYPKRAEQEGIDLRKGVLLSGPVGCGKSSLMTLMNYIPGPGRNYIIRTCRQVSVEFQDDGHKVFARYSTFSFDSHTPKIYCFDDLGAERTIKYFGNECNVLGEILTNRYDLFVTHHMLTHLTTNLSADDIEAQYGSRLRSRLRAQLNLIAFAADSPDKRT